MSHSQTVKIGYSLTKVSISPPTRTRVMSPLQMFEMNYPLEKIAELMGMTMIDAAKTIAQEVEGRLKRGYWSTTT